jgi:hypothetical protein
MHDFKTISTTNKTYTWLQNHTNMVVGEHGVQTFKVVVVVLALDFLSPQMHTFLIIFEQVVCPNILKC